MNALLLLTLLVSVAMADDPLWNPIDPKLFPPAAPTDTVQVFYVKAPLLEAEVGPIFKYFNLYHGGVAFTVVESNFTWTVNYDSVDLSLFSAQMPVIHTASNGSRSLEWYSQGAAYCYAGIHPNYWTTTLIGTVTGAMYNAYVNKFLIPFNGTWPYYEMFNIKDGNNGTVMVPSHECFDFVMRSMNFFKSMQPSFSGAIKRNIVYWIADGVPALVDTSDPKVWNELVDFYEMLEFRWNKVSSFGELLLLLGELVTGEKFYLHVGNVYYRFELEWPVLDVEYVAQSF